MIKIFYDKKFLKQVQRLPARQQEKLAGLLETLKSDPYDSRLHTKKLGPPLEGQFSFRITRDWRVMFHFRDADVVFVTRVEHRKNIYK